MYPLVEGELTEYAEVPIEDARPAQIVEAGIAEPPGAGAGIVRIVYLSERSWIVPSVRMSIFLGVPIMSAIVGELPGQAALQSPVTLNGWPLMRSTLFTCHPETICVSTLLFASQRRPRPNGQIPNVFDSQIMRAIEERGCAIHPQVRE